MGLFSEALATASQKVAKSYLRRKAAYEQQQEALMLQEADLALALHALRKTGSELCSRQMEITQTRAAAVEAGRVLDRLQPVSALVDGVRELLQKGPEDAQAADGIVRMLQQELRNRGENSLADVAPKILLKHPSLRDGFARTAEAHLAQVVIEFKKTVAQTLCCIFCQ